MDNQNLSAFNVRMQTPVGIRLGKVYVYRDDNRLNGQFHILKHNEPFQGIIDNEGNCEISGKIITLMRTINYVATGKITSDSLTLSITDDHYVLKITGTLCEL